MVGQRAVSFVARFLFETNFVLPLYLSWNKLLIDWNSLTWKKWLISLSWKRWLIAILWKWLILALYQKWSGIRTKAYILIQLWSLTEFQFLELVSFLISFSDLFTSNLRTCVYPRGQWFSNNEMQSSSSPDFCILTLYDESLFPFMRYWLVTLVVIFTTFLIYTCPTFEFWSSVIWTLFNNLSPNLNFWYLYYLNTFSLIYFHFFVDIFVLKHFSLIFYF